MICKILNKWTISDLPDISSCGNNNQKYTLYSAKDTVCCNPQLKNLAEGALSVAKSIPEKSPFVNLVETTVKVS